MGSLNVETLDLIQKTAVNASGATNKLAIVPVPGSKIGEFAVVKPTGEFEMMTPELRPPDRKHHLLSVTEVADFVTYVQGTLGLKPVIWYSPAGVSIVLNDLPTSLRADIATIGLVPTKAHEILKSSADAWLSQKAFVRLLRTKLGDCLGESGEQMLKVLRILNFKSNRGGYGKAEHGRESIGQDIENEVISDAGDIPEQIALSVRLYEDPGLKSRFTVRCAIEINAEEATFNIAPFAGELERAVADQMDAIASSLESQTKDIPIFYGTP